jgi:hypothetical protein
VTNAKLANDAVETANILNSECNHRAKLADGAVTTMQKLLDNAVSTAKLQDGSVTTLEKLADGGVSQVLTTDGSGNVPQWESTTGTGSPVRENTPTLITPVIGAATGTSLSVTGSLRSTGPTAGIGYSSGAGNTVSQVTSKITDVAINFISGGITTHNSTLADNTSVVFQVNNSAVSATDVPVITLTGNSAFNYIAAVVDVGSGNFKIGIKNISGMDLSEAITINYVIIKAVHD